MTSRRRVAALVTAIAGLTIVAASPVAAHSAAAGARPHNVATAHHVLLGSPRSRNATPNPLADPTSNTEPSQAFLSACYSMGRTKAANDRCDAAALRDFDRVRAHEGLGPMRLPGGFDRLSVPLQLLTISNIERVDRGLLPVAGLSSSIDSYAQQGANADEDPPFPNNPFPGNAGSANWAGAGNSALLDDFFWMYDDGLGSGNLDCTPSDQSGCWGHRHDVLFAFDAPLLMGAAVAYHTADGTSMTEEFIGGDTTDTADVPPTWLTITQQPSALAISLNKHSIRAHHRLTVTGAVTGLDLHDRLAHQRVALQRRKPHGHWSDLATRRTGPRGAVNFHIRPARTAKYRLQVRASGTVVELTSRALKVVVKQRSR